MSTKAGAEVGATCLSPSPGVNQYLYDVLQVVTLTHASVAVLTNHHPLAHHPVPIARARYVVMAPFAKCSGTLHQGSLLSLASVCHLVPNC